MALDNENKSPGFIAATQVAIYDIFLAESQLKRLSAKESLEIVEAIAAKIRSGERNDLFDEDSPLDLE